MNASCSLPTADNLDRGKQIKVRLWSWAIVLSAVCLAPLALLAVGVDFSSAGAPLTPDWVAGLTEAELDDLHEAAGNADLSMTDFVIARCLGKRALDGR